MKFFKSNKVQLQLAILFLILLFAAIWYLSVTIATVMLWLIMFPITMSFVSGVIKALFLKKTNTLEFALKITAGNFIYDPQDSAFMTIIGRFCWEQPQTFLGNFGMHILNSVWLIKKVDVYKRSLVCQGYFLNGGGIALGSFIMIDLHHSPPVDIFPVDDRTVPERILLRHEYGHLLQSIVSGPLFIFKYGIPSVIMQQWTESDADLRSDTELLLQEQIMPVFSTHKNQKKAINPNWWEYAMLLVSIAIGWYINDVNGILGSVLVASMTITALNMNRPA
jgi:hypothetical protein